MANNRRRLVGRVVSDKMQKTVTVAIERRATHPVYGKVIKFTKKVMAHDETDSIKAGSIVRIVESRPLSKTKRWVVEEVIQTPDGVLVSSRSAAVETPVDTPAEGSAE